MRYRSISSVISLLISTSATKSFHHHHHHRPNLRAVHKQPTLIDFRSTSMAKQQPEGLHDSWEDYRDKVIQNCVLPLSYDTSYKGSSGRIAILGGNELYVGAPYFCGMASLQTGADLVSVYTAEEATTPIKCYSPDLMVQPIYRASDLPSLNINNKINDTDTNFSNHPMVKQIVDNAMYHLQQRHIHCVVIGPGMGRHPLIMTAMSRIITRIILMPSMYLILDADALYMLSLPQHRDLVSGCSNVIITPNQMEYNRLFGNGVYDNSTNCGLNSATIVKKGRTDIIYRHDRFGSYHCSEVGGMKRCGGLGDVLAGTIATFIAWRGILNRFDDVDMTNQEDNVMLACYAACCLVKRATKQAYDDKHRAMSAQDVIHEIGRTFHDMINDGDQ